MIHVRKLMSLSPNHRRRKTAQTLARIEAALRSGDRGFLPWLYDCAQALGQDDELDPGLKSLAMELLAALQAVLALPLSDQAGPAAVALVRPVNRLRRSLEASAGLSPADWDFADPVHLRLDPGARRVFPGMAVYLDDVRSPFNVGSIFRSADAFGVAELLLSEHSADPRHPRASRSAMGATEILPWRRTPIEDLSWDGPWFALELRGESIDEVAFPPSGLVVIGSEELGVSPQAMERCTRRLSIPMLGAKGSLNVGVALGILLNAWRASLEKQGIRAVACPCRQGVDVL